MEMCRQRGGVEENHRGGVAEATAVRPEECAVGVLVLLLSRYLAVVDFC
jgi:hypothetical protein